jgi:formate dehydrogenase iron-sulfur subunit
MVAPKKPLSFIAELLADQQRLQTPVARFAALQEFSPSALQAFRPTLIPLSQPRPGEQYAFEVELDACTGCKACVSACHSLNGLDETETWRDVGLLVGGDHRRPFQQTVTTACHHCADPACANGCPVLAYEKDPTTGIVRHLDDQCIGCSYCILKCPYDVPKYNDRLGIVRKCDMCHGRLAEGEAPACVQACPTHAIRIVTVPTHTATDGTPRADTATFLRTAPDPAYTQPTTRYLTQRALPDSLAPADAAALRPQPPHWPLVFLLTLMPMAVGCGVADMILLLPTPALTVTGWLTGVAGLALSVLHLGQPLRAWRVFLGWRKSWLSREALVFGAWLPLATASAAFRLGWLPTLGLANEPAHLAALRPALALATAACGGFGLLCSVMVYADTHRTLWHFGHTAPRFFGTAIVLGLASSLAMPTAPRSLGFVLALATLLKLACEARALTALDLDHDTITTARQTALLLTGPLRPVNERRVFAALGAIAGALAVALSAAPSALAWLVLVLSLFGELAERSLFFRAVVAPKMPGVAA